MHHRFWIIDNKTLITGSFNPTASADERNDKNIIIISHAKNIKDFQEEFENLLFQ